MVAFEAYLLFESWSLASQLSEEDKERLKSDFLAVPFWVVLLTGAVAPAIAEEFFFRGFVLSAFRSKLTAFRSVLFTSLLFGLFHVIAGSVLSIEKFLPTIILGMAIGYVAVRTGSLFPGILLHALHNGLVFSMSRFTEQDLARWFGEETKHIPVVWLCGGVLSMALGAGVLFLSSQRNQSHEDSN
jgi:ABC-2 type transport system permease protein/sodium transport system permease protein